MKKSIFFDLDGTLWDALVPLTDSWNDAMIKANEPYRFDLVKMKSYMGLTPEETCPLAFPGTDLKEGMRLFKICLDAEIAYLAKNPGILYPHEREVLEVLSKKYPLYVVSNADKGYIQNYLNACDMKKYFKGFVQAGDTGLAKWQNILYMKDKEGIDEVIYVGDTLKDKIETEKAGQKFIHAAYGFGIIEDDEYAINSLEELPAMAEKLFD
jgi:phosphoglycolate phosphatase